MIKKTGMIGQLDTLSCFRKSYEVSLHFSWIWYIGNILQAIIWENAIVCQEMEFSTGLYLLSCISFTSLCSSEAIPAQYLINTLHTKNAKAAYRETCLCKEAFPRPDPELSYSCKSTAGWRLNWFQILGTHSS